MSESVQRDDQWSSLPDTVHFRYDDQHPSLPAEGLTKYNLQLLVTVERSVPESSVMCVALALK
jgi:hypothetical protein